MSQFPLRVPDHVMDEAREAARQDKVSVNQLLLAFIADGLGHRRGLKLMRERASWGDPAAALALLDSLSNGPPETGDEMPVDDVDHSR